MNQVSDTPVSHPQWRPYLAAALALLTTSQVVSATHSAVDP